MSNATTPQDQLALRTIIDDYGNEVVVPVKSIIDDYGTEVEAGATL